MKVLITGSRDYVDVSQMTAVFALLPDAYDTVVHGGQRGADLLAGQVAGLWGLKIEPYPVDQRIDGPWPRAGTNRNTRMLEVSKPDLCIAFPLPGSKGTWDMANKAAAAGVLTLVVHRAAGAR